VIVLDLFIRSLNGDRSSSEKNRVRARVRLRFRNECEVRVSSQEDEAKRRSREPRSGVRTQPRVLTLGYNVMIIALKGLQWRRDGAQRLFLPARDWFAKSARYQALTILTPLQGGSNGGPVPQVETLGKTILDTRPIGAQELTARLVWLCLWLYCRPEISRPFRANPSYGISQGFTLG
jgi:hypothetical protein